MSVVVGTRLGSLEITGLLGRGGMGEVYRARDTKLKREVAIKILPEQFSRDRGRVSRFQREAEVLASLNHPNIAAIYDLQEVDGAQFLVLELVEGETLADRIARGPIPVEEALSIAESICDALEAAHEKGIIHRDLKPANVKVTPDGKVKVLDFGLAKAMDNAPANSTLSNSPTMLGETITGIILGTAPYMSPEQASGSAVGKRTDVWAFGAVLYEMLTGRRLFRGDTTTEILASVIKDEPEWDRIPWQVERLLRLCLRKNPTQRLHDIADAKLLLQEAPTPPAFLRSTRWLWPGATGLFILISALLAVAHFREMSSISEPVRFTIPLPEKVSFTTGSAFAVSPDGRKVVFNATGPEGARLWVRALDSMEAHVLSEAGIVNTGTLFWSPDSRSVAYGSIGKLRRIDIAGGPPQTICDTTRGILGGSWNRTGVIIFGTTGGLMRVAAAGGVATALTVADSAHGELSHGQPFFLPDGKHFLYFISQAENSGIYVGSLDAMSEAQTRRRLIATRFGASYAPASDPAAGRLLFLREGTLMAQAFDAQRIELASDAVPVVERVGSVSQGSRGFFSVSSNGVLMYTAGFRQDFQPTFFDRQGRMTGTVGEPGPYGVVTLSPDGTRAATTLTDRDTNNEDIWLLDPTRGQSTRFTFDPAIDAQPMWSPDGAYIAFNSNRGGEWGIYRKAVNGAAREELLAKTTASPTLTQWTQDGRYLIYFAFAGQTGQDLWVLPLYGDRKPFPFLRAPFNQLGARVSPDGRWIAYRSDETGKNELYVQAFDPKPDAGNAAAAGKWMVSKGSEGMARWRKDGKELYYITTDGSIMAVDVKTNPVFSAGVPRLLFKLPPIFSREPSATGTPGARVDTQDGQRFVVSMPVTENAPPQFSVVLNWQTGLKK
jgi:serine/threonine protein kinase